jgi:hypothetical protein
MNIDLTEEEAAALLGELDGIIANDRYFLSPRITILKAILAKIRPEPIREPLPPPKHKRAAACDSSRTATRVRSEHARRPCDHRGRLLLAWHGRPRSV